MVVFINVGKTIVSYLPLSNLKGIKKQIPFQWHAQLERQIATFLHIAASPAADEEGRGQVEGTHGKTSVHSCV